MFISVVYMKILNEKAAMG